MVLLSGGMDSACAPPWRRATSTPRRCMSVTDSAPKTASAEHFWPICDELGIRDRLVVRNEVLPRHRRLGPDRSQYRSPRVADRTIGEDIPVTYVPFRNAHFLAAAVSWAEVLGAEKVFIGAVEQDSSGYPDCRPAYYQAFNQVVRAGTKEGRIEVLTPLIAMRKAEIVRLGLELGAPLHLTWSCYSREDRACGVCDSCQLRLRAFREAGAEDAIPYVAEKVRA